MPRHVNFVVRQIIPSMDLYRRDWVPEPGLGLAGTWLGAVVSDAAGQDYLGLRGTDDSVPGMTHVATPFCGFRSLERNFDGMPPHLYADYAVIDGYEPIQVEETGDHVQTAYQSGRVLRDADGLHWYDASGRWELHAKTVSDVVIIHVPEQEGVEREVFYRHELMLATGAINGIPVSGYAHQDFAYGPPGTVYPELPIVRSLQGMWVSWLHEDADGRLGGGCFWQGRGDLDFGPGYQLKNGVTTVHDHVIAKPTFNADAKMVELEVAFGSDSYTFAFDTAGSPIHYFGRVVATSSGTVPARSWCWVEYAGDLLGPELLDMMIRQFDLARGR
jgi:hypothetical protein